MIREIIIDGYELLFWSILAFIGASFAVAILYVYRQILSMLVRAGEKEKVTA